MKEETLFCNMMMESESVSQPLAEISLTVHTLNILHCKYQKYDGYMVI